jgi:hypothetical protein
MHEGCLPSWPIVASSFRLVVDHPPLVSRTSLLNTTHNLTQQHTCFHMIEKREVTSLSD